MRKGKGTFIKVGKKILEDNCRSKHAIIQSSES